MAIVRQLGSAQDFAVKGKVNKINYVGVMDGHGGNTCIDMLRKYNYDDVAVCSDPVQELVNRLSNTELYRSGSTFTFAKITEGRVEVFNVGDSQTAVIVNGEMVYITPQHNFQNEAEIFRTKPLMARVEPTFAPFPVSETEVQNVRSDVGYFNTGERLVPSQSLGHNNMTQIAPEKKEILFGKDDKVRVICASDGFWDMYMEHSPMLTTATPEELINEAERRWRQTWTYVTHGTSVQTSYGGQFDDIAISVWEN
jgi:serine/threonine protein phosphatase PrpC